MAWLSAISTVLYVITYPITYLVYFGYGLLQILAAPFVRAGSLYMRLVFIPFRILAQFETLIVFLATACLAGITLGMFMYWIMTLVDLSLNAMGLSQESTQPSNTSHKLKIKPRKRQSDKTGKRSLIQDQPSPPDDYFMRGAGRKPLGLLNGSESYTSTIMEEEEEDEYSDSSERHS